MLMKFFGLTALGGDLAILWMTSFHSLTVPNVEILFGTLFFGGLGLVVVGNLLDEWQRANPRRPRARMPQQRSYRGPNNYPPNR